jgi:YidC/Oxa1 family membrane protein insertase
VDTRRLLVAFLLSLGVILLWYTIFPPPKPTPEAVPPPNERAERATPGPAPVPGAPASPAAPGSAAPGSAPATLTPGEPIAGAAEERVVLQDGRTRAVLTNRGAQLVSMEVPEKTKAKSKSGTLDLVRARAGGPYPYSLTSGKGAAPHPLDQVLFRTEKGSDGRSVLFRYNGPQGVAEKRFRLNEKGLLEVEIRLPGQSGWGVLLGPGIRNPTAEEMKSRFERRLGAYKLGGEKVTRVEPQKAEGAVEVPGRGLSWAGLEDTYFLSAQIPQGGIEQAVFEPVLVQPGEGGARFIPLPPEDQMTKEQEDLPRELLLILRPSGDRLALVSYWGAKELDRLSGLPAGLEDAVDLGFFGVLAKPLLAGLHWIHDNIVANYGWAIILMTVLIKLLLLPLTHKSTVSMRKMQKLNPRVQSIRDRYRTKLRDKQGKPNLEMQRKMNEEVMAVYKESGVNPASGCFPLLLQMPILFAFYSLLSTAVELRKEPWLLWIQDLSVADPYYVLPIVMGLTQFLQVRMGPQAGDPMQRRMFQLMPIFMTFLFLGFPSGLVLYWLTNNVLTILQLQVYNRLHEREE